jgi:hypothetical protein
MAHSEGKIPGAGKPNLLFRVDAGSASRSRPKIAGLDDTTEDLNGAFTDEVADQAAPLTPTARLFRRSLGSASKGSPRRAPRGGLHAGQKKDVVARRKTIMKKVGAIYQPPKGILNTIFNFFFRTQYFKQQCCEHLFNQIDTERKGELLFIEVYLGVVLLFLHLKTFGLLSNPPSKPDIIKMLETIDADGDGMLNRDEFSHLVKVLALHLVPQLLLDILVQFTLCPFLALFFLSPLVDSMLLQFTGHGYFPASWADELTALRLPILVQVALCVWYYLLVPFVVRPIADGRASRLTTLERERMSLETISACSAINTGVHQAKHKLSAFRAQSQRSRFDMAGSGLISAVRTATGSPTEAPAKEPQG